MAPPKPVAPDTSRRTVIRAIPAPRNVNPALTPAPVPAAAAKAGVTPADPLDAPTATPKPPAPPAGKVSPTVPAPAAPAPVKPATVAPRPAPAPVRPAAQAAPPPVRPASTAPAAAPRPAAAPPARPPASVAPASTARRQFEVLPGGVADMDSTMTMRALTPTELEDAGGELYVIQLALAATEIPADQIPNLAIFNEYRLYTTVGLDDGKVMHALRLGFFTDQAPAQAVAGYLAGYFEAPRVTRVSSAERERFSGRRITGCKDSGESGLHAAIEMSSPDQTPTTSLADLKLAAAEQARSQRRPTPRR